MASAEGRARMASQARGLWLPLPDGALKRQLLAELAELVQIDSRELLQVWQPSRPGERPTRRSPRNPAAATPAAEDAMDEPAWAREEAHAALESGPASHGRFRGASGAPDRSRRIPGRRLPASREDRVLRLMLTDLKLWDRLSHQEHMLLCGLSEPHGPLFAWLEAQLHEHGAMPWAALREGLRGHAHENHAVQQLEQIPEGIEPSWDETRPIVDELVRRARQQEMDALAARAATDPQALARFKELAAMLKAGQAS